MLPSGKPDYQAVRDRARASNTDEPNVVDLRELFADVLQIDAAQHRSRRQLRRPWRQFAVLRDDVGAAGTRAGATARGLAATSVRELEAMPESPRRWRPWWGATLETSVALRAVAIVLIVGSHAELFELWGGAHVLLGIAGYNFGRFCLTPVPANRPGAAPAQHHRVDRGTVGGVGRDRADDHRRLHADESVAGQQVPRPARQHDRRYGCGSSRCWCGFWSRWPRCAGCPSWTDWNDSGPSPFAVAFLAAGLALRYDVLGLHLGRRRMVHRARVLVLRGGLGRGQGIDNAAARGGDGRC